MGSNTIIEIHSGDSSTFDLISGGVNSALTGLSQMVNKQLNVTDVRIKQVMVKDVPDLFGGPEAVMVGVYLGVQGYANGHMIVAYKPETAFNLVDMLLGQPISSTQELKEMEQSALGEVGNIMGSFFLNYISDKTGISYRVSPPAIMMDMAGAILDVILSAVLEHTEQTYIVDATFGADDKSVTGTFLVLPVPDLPATGKGGS